MIYSADQIKNKLKDIETEADNLKKSEEISFLTSDGKNAKLEVLRRWWHFWKHRLERIEAQSIN